MNNIFTYYFFLLKHKFLVFCELAKICLSLFKRALYHDNSKLKLSEARQMLPTIQKFYMTKYGSESYKKLLEENREIISLHYAKNDHHIEHFNNYKEMPMLALIEMLADWKVASKQHPNGNLERSFAIAKIRYNLSDEILTFLKTI